MGFFICGEMDTISSHYIVMICLSLVTSQFFWMLVAQFLENFSLFLSFNCWCLLVFLLQTAARLVGHGWCFEVFRMKKANVFHECPYKGNEIL
jgi:hypothetical protein